MGCFCQLTVQAIAYLRFNFGKALLLGTQVVLLLRSRMTLRCGSYLFNPSRINIIPSIVHIWLIAFLILPADISNETELLSAMNNKKSTLLRLVFQTWIVHQYCAREQRWPWGSVKFAVVRNNTRGPEFVSLLFSTRNLLTNQRRDDLQAFDPR
jgi:hypothetical protein